MEQIQNNRVITDLYRENAQFPGIALDGSDVYLCCALWTATTA